MHFSTLALSAISIGSALGTSSHAPKNIKTIQLTVSPAQSVTVHVVTVASKNNTLAYFPSTVTAAVGDMVQFQFAAGNHTVTQSTFDQPCQPIFLNNANVTGFFSGFMPTSATVTSAPTYTIKINSTTPIWVYCSQAKHCQAGMTMVINENVAANATRSLANFQALAAKATVNLPGNVIEGGAVSTNSSSSSSSSSGATTSAAGAGSGTATASTTKATSSSSAAEHVSPMGMGVLALAGLVALL